MKYQVINYIYGDTKAAKNLKKQRLAPAKSTSSYKEEKDSIIKIPKIISIVSATAMLANSAIGTYTGNKVREQNNKAKIGIAASFAALVAAKNPLGVIALVGTIAKRNVDIRIEALRIAEESQYKKSYLGEITTSGSRWRGGR